MIWPFPLLRNYHTSSSLTGLFLAFAGRDDLLVKPLGLYRTVVSCPIGRLEFWTGNAYYAWGDNGSFTNSDGVENVWVDAMPSRWAVRKMANAIDRQRFKIVNKDAA